MQSAACEVPTMWSMCGTIHTLYTVVGYSTMYVE